MKNRFLMILSSGLMGFFVIGCSQPEISSRWNDGNIAVDGRITDWDQFQAFTNDEPISVSAENTSDEIFLCARWIRENPQAPPPIIGLTLWIEPEKGEYNRLGFKLLGKPERTSTRGTGSRRDSEPEKTGLVVPDANSEIEVVDDENIFVNRIIPNTYPGFNWAMSVDQDQIILEMQLPMTDKKLGLWDFSSHEQIEIGISTGLEKSEMGEKEMGGGMHGGGGMGGRSGSGIGGGPGSMGGGRMMRHEMPESMEAWATVILAKEN